VIDDELEEARRLVVEALEWMPCASERLDATLVAGLWQVSAAVEFYGASEQAAIPDIGRAKSIPGTVFRPRLGKELRGLWEKTVPDLNAQLVLGPLPEPNLLYVDGALRPNGELMLTTGPHLVQIWNGEQVVFQRAINLNLGERAEIATGLEPTEKIRRAPPLLHSPFFWGGVAGGITALGFYGDALYKDGQMKQAKKPDQVHELRNESLRSRSFSRIAGAVGAASFALHFAF
jgi:hypothetical protein